MVEGLAAIGGPPEQFYGAVDGDPLFVAGNQERDRTLWLSAARFDVIKYSSQRARDSSRHVHRAASVKRVVGDFPPKRWMGPFALVAGGHHVGVARKDKMR